MFSTFPNSLIFLSAFQSAAYLKLMPKYQNMPMKELCFTETLIALFYHVCFKHTIEY